MWRSIKSRRVWSWEMSFGGACACLPAGRQSVIGLAGSKARAPSPRCEHHHREERKIRCVETRQHGVDLGVRDQSLGDSLPAHLGEVRGIEACTEAAALAHRDVPLHADLGQPSYLEPAIETAPPLHLEASV